MASLDRPTVYCLPFLGGSGRGWQPAAERLPPWCRCVPLALPGFGEAASLPGYTVAEMADRVATVIRADAPRRWVVAGHSMGAKVAAVLARRSEDGEAGLDGLAGLVMLAASPPSPEPMDETRRQEMLGWFTGDDASRRAEARRYVEANVGTPLDPAVAEAVVTDVLLADRAAWVAWLSSGSREDWADRIGVLRTPVLIVSGSEDADLGEAAQRKLTARHFTQAEFVTLPGAGHLLPMERPDDVARLIAMCLAAPPSIPDDYRALIGSARVSTGTRDALLSRAAPDNPAYVPACLSVEQFGTLRALVDRVVPQERPGEEPGSIDLAARLDAALAAGPGDGWRFAGLPPDAEAWRAGLQTLAALGFPGSDPDGQDALLGRVAAGEAAAAGEGLLTAGQMRMWFEDVCADAVRLYVAHPATLARMGYGGIGYGGDGPGKPGFVRLGAGEREAWEPVAP